MHLKNAQVRDEAFRLPLIPQDVLLSGCSISGSPQTKSNPPVIRNTNRTLAVPIDIISFTDAQDRVLRWANTRASRYVVLANAHVVVTASRDKEFGEAIASADMAAPDGAPVAWMLRMLGSPAQERVSGPDLMWALLERCSSDGISVYFFGSTPETLRKLIARTSLEFKNLSVAGADSPPFRTLSQEEDDQVVRRINESGAGLVFVGLGCPKQEHWMQSHRGKINAVMLGVGAAFDFHAGTVQRAPTWMRERGLEWLHRLCSEPRRLWKRYLVTNTLFVFGAANQLLRFKLNR